MNFIVIDLTLLALFTISVSILLYKNKKNLGKEGSLVLYRTKWGVKLIDKIGKKYRRTLKFLSYVSIILGFILMILILILIFQSVYLYFTTSIAKTIKAPPVMPLIPYFPQLFGLESLFPPFYFVYFILALIIVATSHEFSHGIFARRYGVKIKSTGFAFLKYFPAIFGAFVEQNEKQMNKKKKFEQMSILSAGVFANVIMTLIFFILIVFLFSISFVPSGVVFDTYSYTIVPISNITIVNSVKLTDVTYENVLDALKNDSVMNKITSKDNRTYLVTKDFLQQQNNSEYAILYDDSPAINAGLGATITEINGVKITSMQTLQTEFMKYSSGEKIIIKTITDSGEISKEVILGKNPSNESLPWLGIGFIDKTRTGFLGKVYNVISFFKDPNIYYAPKYEMSTFIYDLFWWIIVINLLVALFNMLPLGFLDGGRFFYLGLLSLTGSKKVAEKSFAFMTYLLLFLLLLMMIKWVFIFF